MINRIATIPTVFRGILITFLTIFMIRVTYPISNTILGLFQSGIWKVVSIMIYWLIILFCTWFMTWVLILKPSEVS